MEYRFRPIVAWPGAFTARRKPSPFRATYTDTLRLLDRELRHLGAREIVIQLALQEGDIRLDGLPRSGSRPAHPGVILSFQSRYGPLSYPCDTFQTWESNLRAVAMSLEHLRAVDRYGVTRRGEQYRGWSALEAPKAETMTPTSAAFALFNLTVGHSADAILADREKMVAAYRDAVMRHHPDRGGDRAAFEQARQAKEILDRHFAQE